MGELSSIQPVGTAYVMYLTLIIWGEFSGGKQPWSLWGRFFLLREEVLSLPLPPRSISSAAQQLDRQPVGRKPGELAEWVCGACFTSACSTSAPRKNAATKSLDQRQEVEKPWNQSPLCPSEAMTHRALRLKSVTSREQWCEPEIVATVAPDAGGL